MGCDRDVKDTLNESNSQHATGHRSGIACCDRDVKDTLNESKASIQDAILEYIETCKEYKLEIPQELIGKYQLIFELDIQSLLTIYQGIFTKSALEKITGINQKQLWHYAQGLSKPRYAQRQKIETALHTLGSELVSLSL